MKYAAAKVYVVKEDIILYKDFYDLELILKNYDNIKNNNNKSYTNLKEEAINKLAQRLSK